MLPDVKLKMDKYGITDVRDFYSEGSRTEEVPMCFVNDVIRKEPNKYWRFSFDYPKRNEVTGEIEFHKADCVCGNLEFMLGSFDKGTLKFNSTLEKSILEYHVNEFKKSGYRGAMLDVIGYFLMKLDDGKEYIWRNAIDNRGLILNCYAIGEINKLYHIPLKYLTKSDFASGTNEMTEEHKKLYDKFMAENKGLEDNDDERDL